MYNLMIRIDEIYSRAMGMRREMGREYVLPVALITSTLRTRPSWLGIILLTLSNLQTPLGRFSSNSITTSFSFRFGISEHHFFLGPSMGMISD